VTPIEQLSDLLGQEATVEGTVVGSASFSAGLKLTLDDDTGRVVLLLWHDVYDDCWSAAGLNLGARVRATGRVGSFEGETQVTPRWGGAIDVLEPAAAWAEPREMASLGAQDQGRRVMIEGQVIRTEGLSSAVKVFVRDATGEVLVFIWRNVLDRIQNNVGLGTEGSHVRVVGTVDIYRGTLEVVPTLPTDVTVLEIP
jgi:DNA/RNA endonuclease YhcR with UshA esterase domain